MAERTEERTRDGDTHTESEFGVDVGVGETTTAESTTDAGGRFFSVRALLYAFVAVGVGTVVGGLVPLVPLSELLGILLGGFVYGLLASQRRYLEIGLAGGVSAGLTTTLALLPQLVAGLDGGRLFAVAGAVGLVLALVGHYFGRDLRDGLTRDLG